MSTQMLTYEDLEANYNSSFECIRTIYGNVYNGNTFFAGKEIRHKEEPSWRLICVITLLTQDGYNKVDYNIHWDAPQVDEYWCPEEVFDVLTKNVEEKERNRLLYGLLQKYKIEGVIGFTIEFCDMGVITYRIVPNEDGNVDMKVNDGFYG